MSGCTSRSRCCTGSGARGALPLAPDLDSCDDVFNATGWLLQYHRLSELQSEIARAPTGAEMQIFFDTQGVLHAVPAGTFTTPTTAEASAENSASSASGGTAASEHGAFVVSQHVEVVGLASRADLNGQLGEILAPGKTGGRYPVKLGGASVRIKEQNLQRTAYSPQEGQIVNGFVMVCGEWFPMPRFVEFSIDACEASSKRFAALDKAAQADVLSGRRDMPPLSEV